MRLIDADLLKEEIHCSYSDDLEILDKIDRQPTVNKWIPCSESLPEKSGYYLTTQVVHSLAKFETILRKDVEYVGFMHGEWKRAKHLEVIAWQPLPEPYKEI